MIANAIALSLFLSFIIVPVIISIKHEEWLIAVIKIVAPIARGSTVRLMSSFRSNNRDYLTCLTQNTTGRRPFRNRSVIRKQRGGGRTPVFRCGLRSPCFDTWTLSPGHERYPLSGGIKSIKAIEKRKSRSKKKKERERARKTFSDVARKTCSHTRTQWRKSLTWMIAADQLVGREVSFSKSGFQFPKGAYTAYTDGIAFSSEFASGVTNRASGCALRERNAPTEYGRILCFANSLHFFFFFLLVPSFGWPVDGSTPRENLNRVYS